MSSKTKSTSVREKDKPALVPKLRFPTFRGAEWWKTITLGEEATILRGKGISKADLDPEGAQPCIRYGELYTRYGETIKKAVSRTAVPPTELLLSKRDDVIIPSSGETKIDIAKASCVLADNIALGGDLNVIRSKLNGTFLSYYLNGPKKFDIAKVAQGDTVVHLYPHQLESLRIAFPSLAEQQKIAECLSLLDEMMAAQARKVEGLKEHKKGLLQQLFPSEGETQPRLRFPEFQNAGEWAYRQLAEFITERNQYPEEAVPLFSLTIEDGVTPKTERYERSFLVTKEKDAYKLVLPNDFAFNPMNLRFGAIGRHSGAEKVAVSKYYNIFFCDGTVDSRFCEIYFKSDDMVAFYDQMAIGSLIEKRRVHFGAFLQFQIRFPRIEEQQRIATCLSSLDALITDETQKHEALKTHKKGLMQQLFPSSEE
jgi:type I restriction enzyme S subunit